MLSANERRLKLKIGIRIFCKKSSNFVQKEPQIETSESEREKDWCATGAEEGKKVALLRDKSEWGGQAEVGGFITNSKYSVRKTI